MNALTVKETAPGAYELVTDDGQHVNCLNPFSTIEQCFEKPEYGKDAHLIFPSEAGARDYAEYFRVAVR